MPPQSSCGPWNGLTYHDSSAYEFCKPLPGDAAWPTTDAWNTLNQTVSGRLVAPVPAAAVCHRSWAQYNNASCATVQAQWNLTEFQALDPVLADYNDVSCLPYPGTPCSADGYPEYVIVAQTVEDVQAGVNFARDSGVRLVIKGTGHDYPGRSSGPDSLSLYMHNIRGLSVNYTDARATTLGAYASVKISAGMRLGEVYSWAAQNDITVIGGSDPHVGIGGWLSGGGHGPLTARYGMGADQAMEMEVVTADGHFRTINAESNADLFWALRGGGAGTYAVLISVTVKAYPSVDATELGFSYNTTSSSDAFWSLAAYFSSQLPHLAESGLYGYYYLSPTVSTGPNTTIGEVYGAWIGPNLTLAQMQAITAPMEAHMQSAQWGDAVVTGSSEINNGNFMTYWSMNTPETAGYSARVGSRLLTNSSLRGDFDSLRSALRTSLPAGQFLGHLVGPAPNTLNPTGSIAGGSNSVLPAWRRTYSHVILQRSWTSLNWTQMHEVTTALREVQVPALRALEPDSGAYMSESDPTEPNWQQTKFGENYPRLLSIKQRWDPNGVFWCNQCVGSELWDALGDYGIENGVGQNKVHLCRNQSSHVGTWQGSRPQGWSSLVGIIYCHPLMSALMYCDHDASTR